MSAKKKKRNANKKGPTAKKVRRRAKTAPSTSKRAKAGGQGGNEYDSWTGAATTTGREIFDTATQKPLKLNDPAYADIDQYLPPISDKDLRFHYFVAKVATFSKKVGGKKEVLKVFVNRRWNDTVARQLEDMDFTKVGDNRDRLKSDVRLQIQTEGSVWQADSFVEIFRDLDPPGKPTAKVVFTHRDTGQKISAFWCW